MYRFIKTFLTLSLLLLSGCYVHPVGIHYDRHFPRNGYGRNYQHHRHYNDSSWNQSGYQGNYLGHHHDRENNHHGYDHHNNNSGRNYQNNRYSEHNHNR